MSLHRNRYIIALYSKDNDTLVGVYDNISEMCAALKCTQSGIRSALSRKRQRFHLIDLFKVEKDIFEETDISALCLYELEQMEERKASNLAKEADCSVRTIYRKREVFKSDNSG